MTPNEEAKQMLLEVLRQAAYFSTHPATMRDAGRALDCTTERRVAGLIVRCQCHYRDRLSARYGEWIELGGELA